MGDALCGPSNALQNFQKHTAVDRTLQQDRLISRQPSGQGFRSQSPRDGILDPEFAAFEANHGVPGNLTDLQHPAHFQAPTQHPAAIHQGPNWASDFQNLHISGPAPPQLQAPSIAPAQAGWHNEYMSQQHQQRAANHQAQAHQPAHHAFQPAFAPSYPMYNASMNTHQVPQQAPVMNAAPTEQFDESAFEAAFEQARADMQELQETEVVPEIESFAHEETVQLDPAAQVHEEIRIGSDTIPQTEQGPLTQNRDADALAQTAGQLLDSVRHEQDQKFQQSNFLALMRRIRDREVQVEGDEFREVSSNPRRNLSIPAGGITRASPRNRPRRPTIIVRSLPYPQPQKRPVPSDWPESPPENDILEPSLTAEEESPRLGTNPNAPISPISPGDSNEIYEGWIHSHGLVDRQRPTFCFRGEHEVCSW